MSHITLEAQGRRIYVRGNTFPIKDSLRAVGAKWDPEAKAWWAGSGKRGDLEALVAKIGTRSAEGEREAPGDGATVAGRATYKGKTYYVAGRLERGRTHYEDRVRSIESRDGSRVLLHFRDGSRSFWAARAEVDVQRRYERPTTIRGLRRFAEQRRAEERGEAKCPVCAKHCTCGTSFCHHHYDGCERCGAEH